MTYRIKHIRQASLTNDDGRETPVSYLGKGMFCEAWQNGTGVYLIVREVKGQMDYSKEILSQYLQHEDNPHIPQCQQLGGFGSGEAYIYKMPFYEKLTAKHITAWADYRELSKIRQDKKNRCPKPFMLWPTLPLIMDQPGSWNLLRATLALRMTL